VVGIRQVFENKYLLKNNVLMAAPISFIQSGIVLAR
jgi:hypothetical protein